MRRHRILVHLANRNLEFEIARRVYVHAVARFVARHVVPEHPDGFTFDPANWRFPRFPDDVHLVALRGHGWRFPARPSEEQVVRWMASKIDQFFVPDTLVRGSVNREDGSYSLDLSVPLSGRENAIRAAEENGERSILHAASGMSVSLEPSRVPSDVQRIAL